MHSCVEEQCSRKCIFSSFFFFNRVLIQYVSHKKRCLESLIQTILTGAIAADGSELNLIGNISFEGNHL